MQQEDIVQQFRKGELAAQLNAKNKARIDRVNWNINSIDKKQHEPMIYEKKSVELFKKA